MISKESIENSNIRKENHSITESFEHVDVNNWEQIQEILEICKDPVNMEHLAGISQKTEISDIIQHYKNDVKVRDGRVMLENGHVVGVFEVSPFDPSKGVQLPNDPTWRITSAILNRVAIRSDEHNKGKGTEMIKHAEKVAFEEHGYTALNAAIILDPKQKEQYKKPLEEGRVNEVSQDYEKTDPRGKLYIKNRGWKLTGWYPDQGGSKDGENSYVLVVAKTKAAWLEEQAQLQLENNPKTALLKLF
jgi:hypothetical protein